MLSRSLFAPLPSLICFALLSFLSEINDLLPQRRAITPCVLYSDDVISDSVRHCTFLSLDYFSYAFRQRSKQSAAFFLSRRRTYIIIPRFPDLHALSSLYSDSEFGKLFPYAEPWAKSGQLIFLIVF
jgi:hypothetical protein